MTPAIPKRVLALVRRHREKMLYLVVGGWNTVFGYAVYVMLVTLLGRQNYWWLLVPSNIIGVTHNFFTYKYIVFRTRGRSPAEYVRFWIVYLPYLAGNLVLLPAIVSGLGLDPRAGQGVYAVIAFVATYIGHKYFTFREPDDAFRSSGDRGEEQDRPA